MATVKSCGKEAKQLGLCGTFAHGGAKPALVISVQQTTTGDTGLQCQETRVTKGGEKIHIQVGRTSVGWIKAVEKSNNGCSNRYTSEAGSIRPDFWCLRLTHHTSVSGRFP